MSDWLKRLRRIGERRALSRRHIADELWLRTAAQYPFIAGRAAADQADLRQLSSLFLDRKQFSGAHGLVVDDAMAVAIAAQACLPILRLGLQWYDGFVGIVVHDDQVQVRRDFVDDAGVVHEFDDVLSGEAMQGGPVMLSWRDVAAGGESSHWGYNVVIHEFAHVLDMADGEPDGMPPLSSTAERKHWRMVLDASFARFRRRVDAGRKTLLDPYGAESPEEFFAVSSEAFFVAPRNLAAEMPAWYALLAGFYRQDPGAGN